MAGYGTSYFPNAPTGAPFGGVGNTGMKQLIYGNGSGGGGMGGGISDNAFDGKFGMNIPTFQLGLQGIGMGLNFWNAFQAQKLAKEQFNFQKEFANKNLANQIKSYNTSLEDRGRARAAMEGQSAEEAQTYIDNNRL